MADCVLDASAVQWKAHVRAAVVQGEDAVLVVHDEHWAMRTMQEPHWAHLRITPIDYQSISYYSAPKPKADAPKSLEEVDPKLL